jgi:hypothetical protein
MVSKLKLTNHPGNECLLTWGNVVDWILCWQKLCENLCDGKVLPILMLSLCGIETDMEWQWHGAYQLLGWP